MEFMKSKVLLMLLIILAFSINIGYSQVINTPYNFPVKPGTDEWRSLKNNKEKVAVCQIPSDVIGDLSTSNLLETCLNYPLLLDIYAFNSFQSGFNKCKNDFNGIAELFKREDISEILIAKYKTQHPSEYDANWTLVKKGKFSIDISLIELFISQPEVLNQLDLNQKKDLTKELLDKYSKYTSNDIFGSLNYVTNALSLVNVLEGELILTDFPNEKSKNNMLHFASTGTNLSNTTLSNIILLSNQFIDN